MFLSCSVIRSLPDGQRCEVTDALSFHVKVISFSSDHEFKVLTGGPYPAILGLDLLDRTKMLVDVASRKFSFWLAPNFVGIFSLQNPGMGNEQVLQNLCGEASDIVTGTEAWIGGKSLGSTVADFPVLFSPKLGTATSTP